MRRVSEGVHAIAALASIVLVGQVPKCSTKGH
jgi:hypothetical protein